MQRPARSLWFWWILKVCLTIDRMSFLPLKRPTTATHTLHGHNFPDGAHQPTHQPTHSVCWFSLLA